MKLEHDLLTDRYTEVTYDNAFKYDAPNDFAVRKVETLDNKILATIHFQEAAYRD